MSIKKPIAGVDNVAVNTKSLAEFANFEIFPCDCSVFSPQ